MLYKLPGWTVISKGRVGALDKIVSKHLLVLATHEKERVYFLAVHQLRPIGAQAEKHDRQLAAIGEWVKEQLAREPGATVVVLGDTNNSNRAPLYGIGHEVGELNGFAATHLSGKAFDRLVVAGPGSWSAVEIRKPPYGTKRNDGNNRVWTAIFSGRHSRRRRDSFVESSVLQHWPATVIHGGDFHREKTHHLISRSETREAHFASATNSLLEFRLAHSRKLRCALLAA
jgi:hypothetical protein